MDTWRKSSYSGSNGGQCVEVGQPVEAWRKSSYSGSNGGDCVEVGQGDGVSVRDTTNRGGAVLSFSASAWQEFLGLVR